MNKEERQRLIDKITDWNGNRLDLFEISLPDERSEFHGVIRFFYQGDDMKFQSKCIRVSSVAHSRQMVNVLIEKFHPDLKMLSLDKYGLYENHATSGDRRLRDDESPLQVQLNWAKDDREGKFILKNETRLHLAEMNNNQQFGSRTSGLPQSPSVESNDQNVSGFKRRWSSKKKKKRKEEGIVGGASTVDSSRPPDSSFTRTISNPDEVMRRKRQQKLESRLEQFNTNDGATESGGTLKIYGDSINSEVPYKTLLLSVNDDASWVVKETLEKYGLDNANPAEFMIVQVNLPPRGEKQNPNEANEFLLRDTDCPLGILVYTPPQRGNAIFQIRRRTATNGKLPYVPPAPARQPKTGRRSPQHSADGRQMSTIEQGNYPGAVPYLVELNPDGTNRQQSGATFRLANLREGQAVRIGSLITAVGPPPNCHLPADTYPDVRPVHCQLRCRASDGLVILTPALDTTVKPQGPAPVWLNNQRVMGPAPLQSGMAVRLARTVLFRYIDPATEQKRISQQQPMQILAGQQHPPLSPNSATMNQGGPQPLPVTDLLPLCIDYRPDQEVQLLEEVISAAPPPLMESQPAQPQQQITGQGGRPKFKLAPAYTLYLIVRRCLREMDREEVHPEERVHRLAALLNDIASRIYQVIQRDREQVTSLAFWMANASELLNFLKQDYNLQGSSLEAQDTLAGAVEQAFNCLHAGLERRLVTLMPAFLSPNDQDMHDDQRHDDTPVEVGQHPMRTPPSITSTLQCLSYTMNLLRRCRVNAALTIQLFSQLFHLVNQWLFNRLVGGESNLIYVSQEWGDRILRRLKRVSVWAHRQGLELAAECHLQKISQACTLLVHDKSDVENLYQECMDYLSLNSLQLSFLLENYQDVRIPYDWIELVVSGARELSDRAHQEQTPELRLEEDDNLHLPLLLPADGYSVDIPVEGLPQGMTEYLLPLQRQGIVNYAVNRLPQASWTAYLRGNENGSSSAPSPGIVNGQSSSPMTQTRLSTNEEPLSPALPGDRRSTPEDIQDIQISKYNNSLGLSIVAAKGENQNQFGIYIKEVVPNGAAQRDGRLATGDQLLAVEGVSLIGVTQADAARVMSHTGQIVTLTIGKGAANVHGLFNMISEHQPQQSTAPVAPGQTGSLRGQAPPAAGMRPQGPPPASMRPQGPPPASMRPQGPPPASMRPQNPPPASMRPQGPPPAGIRPQGPPPASMRPQGPPPAGNRPPGAGMRQVLPPADGRPQSVYSQQQFQPRGPQMVPQPQRPLMRPPMQPGVNGTLPRNQAPNQPRFQQPQQHPRFQHPEQQSSGTLPRREGLFVKRQDQPKQQTINRFQPRNDEPQMASWKSETAVDSMNNDADPDTSVSSDQQVSSMSAAPVVGAPGAPQRGRINSNNPHRLVRTGGDRSVGLGEHSRSTPDLNALPQKAEPKPQPPPKGTATPLVRPVSAANAPKRLTNQQRPRSSSITSSSSEGSEGDDSTSAEDDLSSEAESTHLYSNLPPPLPAKPDPPATPVTSNGGAHKKTPPPVSRLPPVATSTAAPVTTATATPVRECVWTETDLDRNRETRHMNTPPPTPLNAASPPPVKLGGYQPPYINAAASPRPGPEPINSMNRQPQQPMKVQSPLHNIQNPKSPRSPASNNPQSNNHSGTFFQAELRSPDSNQPVRAHYIPATNDRSPSPELPPPPTVNTRFQPPPTMESQASPPLPPPPSTISQQPRNHNDHQSLPYHRTSQLQSMNSLPYQSVAQPRDDQDEELTPPPQPTASHPQYHPPSQLMPSQRYAPQSQPSYGFSHGPPSLQVGLERHQPQDADPNRASLSLDLDTQDPYQRQRVQMDFQRRLAEQDSRPEYDEEELSTAAVGSPHSKDKPARIAVIKSMRESLERVQNNKAVQDAEQKERFQEIERESQENQQRKLAEFDREREEERLRQQQRADQRAKDHEEWLNKQQLARESQRLIDQEREQQFRRQEESRPSPPITAKPAYVAPSTNQSENRPRYGRPRFDQAPSAPLSSTNSPPMTHVAPSYGSLSGNKKSVSFDTNLESVADYPVRSMSGDSWTADHPQPSRPQGPPPPPPLKPKPTTAPRPFSSYNYDDAHQVSSHPTGITGSQEVYTWAPRQRPEARPQSAQDLPNQEPGEQLSFHEKMRLFGAQAEVAREDANRIRASNRQRLLDRY